MSPVSPRTDTGGHLQSPGYELLSGDSSLGEALAGLPVQQPCCSRGESTGVQFPMTVMTQMFTAPAQQHVVPGTSTHHPTESSRLPREPVTILKVQMHKLRLGSELREPVPGWERYRPRACVTPMVCCNLPGWRGRALTLFQREGTHLSRICRRPTSSLKREPTPTGLSLASSCTCWKTDGETTILFIHFTHYLLQLCANVKIHWKRDRPGL